jgi:hypothetical protein
MDGEDDDSLRFSLSCLLLLLHSLQIPAPPPKSQVNKPKSLTASGVYENKQLCLTAWLEYCIEKQGIVLQGKAKQLEQMWKGSIYGTCACTPSRRLIVATSLYFI